MHRLAASVYNDPREVVWKHLVAQVYWDVVNTLRGDEVPIGDYDPIRLSFVKAFNSQHDIGLLCRHAEVMASTVVAGLATSGREETAARIGGQIAAARASLQRAMEGLDGLRHVDRGPSYVADGLVMIAGKPAEVFAANPDFIGATLELVGEDAPEVAAQALQVWRSGFALDGETVEVVRAARLARWSGEDLLAEVLLREQRTRRYAGTLREFESSPALSSVENRRAKLGAIEEGYFLLGRLMSCSALLNDGGAPIAAGRLRDLCPIGATLVQAGIRLDPSQLAAFRRFVLVRCTHGLNPGEFTARIAASVRATFPRALLASLMVRAGHLHGGALTECMKLLDAYLSSPSREAFTRQRLDAGELYGFGHRIHKSAPEGSGRTGDPRVVLQLATARQAFPRMAGRIDAFESFAALVRAAKPTLAPNTDFGAAVWFHCLGLTPEVGAALFHMSRLPGLIAQVVHQLDVKANALRPPLAVNLTYTL